MSTADNSRITETTQIYRLIDGQWRVAHVNWSFIRHPAVMQGLMACPYF